MRIFRVLLLQIEIDEDSADSGRKERSSSLPSAVFHSGEAHLVGEAHIGGNRERTAALLPAVSPTLPSSPLYEGQADSLPASMLERQRTTWIASVQTKQLLGTMAMGTQLTRIDPSYLTMPGLVVDDFQVCSSSWSLSHFGISC